MIEYSNLIIKEQTALVIYLTYFLAIFALQFMHEDWIETASYGTAQYSDLSYEEIIYKIHSIKNRGYFIRPNNSEENMTLLGWIQQIAFHY